MNSLTEILDRATAPHLTSPPPLSVLRARVRRRRIRRGTGIAVGVLAAAALLFALTTVVHDNSQSVRVPPVDTPTHDDAVSATEQAINNPPPCPPEASHDAPAPYIPPPSALDEIAAGRVGMGDHCGTHRGWIPYPLPSGLVAVTDDAGSVVGYEYPGIGFIEKSVIDAPGFEISQLEAIAAKKAAAAQASLCDAVRNGELPPMMDPDPACQPPTTSPVDPTR